MATEERQALTGLILAVYHCDTTALAPLSDLLEEIGQSFHVGLTVEQVVQRIRTGQPGWNARSRWAAAKWCLSHMLHNVMGAPWAVDTHSHPCPACDLIRTTIPVVQTPSAHA